MILLIFINWSDEDFEKIKKRNPLLISKVYKEYHNKIFNFLMLKTNGNVDLSNDLVSDTFMTALKYIPNVKSAKGLQSWLFTIARNKFIDKINKMNKESSFIDEIEVDHYEEEKKADYQLKEKVLILNLAKKRLTEKHRVILDLKYKEDKSQKEIAKIIGKTENAVQNLLLRARKALKQKVNQILKDYYA